MLLLLSFLHIKWKVAYCLRTDPNFLSVIWSMIILFSEMVWCHHSKKEMVWNLQVSARKWFLANIWGSGWHFFSVFGSPKDMRQASNEWDHSKSLDGGILHAVPSGLQNMNYIALLHARPIVQIGLPIGLYTCMLGRYPNIQNLHWGHLTSTFFRNTWNMYGTFHRVVFLNIFALLKSTVSGKHQIRNQFLSGLWKLPEWTAV